MLRELTADDLAAIKRIRWFHSIPVGTYQGVEYFTPGEVPHATSGPSVTERFGMPPDLTGKTVLDIGAWDGGFSFEAERRGAARVVACDIACSSDPKSMQVGNWGKNEGFNLAHELLDSEVEFIESSLNDLYETADSADIVLLYGVLYHVIDPFAALLKVRQLTQELALIETAIAQGTDCKMELRNGFNGDFTNWWYPTVSCLKKMLECVGFRSAEVIYDCEGVRVTVAAHK